MSDVDSAYNDREWHLDKRIPITLIIAILLQTGGAVWFGAKLDSRVAANEKVLSARGTWIEEVDDEKVELAKTLTELNVTLRGVIAQTALDRQTRAKIQSDLTSIQMDQAAIKSKVDEIVKSLERRPPPE